MGFLKGKTRVNRKLLTKNGNQVIRSMNNLESFDCLQKAGEGCGLPLSEGIC